MAGGTNGYASAMDKNEDQDGQLSLSEFTAKKQKLFQLINNVRNTGAATVVELPTIVVIGNQSAGKSSVIEAIAQVKVPRDSGTCTRCPMEHRWQFSALEPFVQWAALDDEWAAAEEAAANEAAWKKDALPCSKNVVCVEIRGPDLTDLAFVDLPGIVSNTTDWKEEQMIPMIQEMIKEYIKGQSIILLTVTMKDDQQNQMAGKLAREADEKGARTICVLTKPDQVEAGDERGWIDLLSGRGQLRSAGVFVVRNPAGKDRLEMRGIKGAEYFARARLLEEDYLQKEPWGSLAVTLREQMGAGKLATALSSILMRAVSKRLPQLIKEVETLHTRVQKQLRELPQPPSDDPAVELWQRCSGMRDELKSYASGAAGHEALLQDMSRAYKSFQKTIIQHAPEFDLVEKWEADAGKEKIAPENEDEEESEEEDEEVEGEGEVDMTDDKKMSDAPPSSQGLKANITDVRRIIERSRTRELPGSVPYPAKLELMKQANSGWMSMTLACLDSVKPLIVKLLEKLAIKHFGTLGQARKLIAGALDDVARRLFAENERNLRWVASLDTYSTRNSHYFTASTEKYFAAYRAARNPAAGFEPKVHVGAVLSQLAQIGYTGLKKEDLKRLAPEDQCDEELRVMAEVRAWYQIGYKRIIDLVPDAIHSDIVLRLPEAISEALPKALQLEKGNEWAMTLTKEPPGTTWRRGDLKNKLKMLTEALDAIRNFERV